MTPPESALESSDAEPPASDVNPLVAKTLYSFGVGALAAGLVYFAFERGGDAAAVGTYAALFAGLFGAVFLWLGSVEG